MTKSTDALRLSDLQKLNMQAYSSSHKSRVTTEQKHETVKGVLESKTTLKRAVI